MGVAVDDQELLEPLEGWGLCDATAARPAVFSLQTRFLTQRAVGVMNHGIVLTPSSNMLSPAWRRFLPAANSSHQRTRHTLWELHDL